MQDDGVLDQLPTDPKAGRVFGEPYVTPDGSTVIPAARIRNGRDVAALGVFIVRGDQASWVPVVDTNRVALLGVLTGLLSAVIGSLAVLRQPPWPRIVVSKD
ncbi:MAG: hypothetical protein JO236_09995 [Mycobacterium sp.]|uniref:hypothetical protein n=1 Tax=Mycobacterium sp. TaxID=1785 RepID=UPI001EC8FFF6|nr:hypothetical protein [Mycobacterium sp.]MBW0017858.1 hypothetical protein [Mycobacterium sp.]